MKYLWLFASSVVVDFSSGMHAKTIDEPYRKSLSVSK